MPIQSSGRLFYYCRPLPHFLLSQHFLTLTLLSSFCYYLLSIHNLSSITLSQWLVISGIFRKQSREYMNYVLELLAGIVKVINCVSVYCISARRLVRTMATLEIIKKDYMQKRSQMKSRIKSENYRHRWFELLPLVLRYSDGSLDVSILQFSSSLYLSIISKFKEPNCNMQTGLTRLNERLQWP